MKLNKKICNSPMLDECDEIWIQEDTLLTEPKLYVDTDVRKYE